MNSLYTDGKCIYQITKIYHETENIKTSILLENVLEKTDGVHITLDDFLSIWGEFNAHLSYSKTLYLTKAILDDKRCTDSAEVMGRALRYALEQTNLSGIRNAIPINKSVFQHYLVVDNALVNR
jgi:hypothetical protein